MTERIIAVLVVPNGTHRPEPLAETLRAHHPAWEVGALWCGDPQLRPRLRGLEWFECAGENESTLIAGDALDGEWRYAVDASAQLVSRGVDRVVLLWVGACAVLSGIDALVGEDDRTMTLVVRAVDALPTDGLAPGEADLISHGVYSTSVAAFTATAGPALAWLSEQLDDRASIAALLPRAAQLFGAEECRDPAIGVGRWRWGCDEPALLDLAGYDARSPWTLDLDASGPQRIELIGNPVRRGAMNRAAPQLDGRRTELCLPGGLKVDAVVRRVVAESADAPPAPWSDAGAFRAWLAPRYWESLHAERPDLWAAFPDPAQRSATGFRQWCRQAFVFEDIPLLLEAPQATRTPLTVAERLRSDGVNLIGYFESELGLGDVVRRLSTACDAAGVSHSDVASRRTHSPAYAVGEIANRVEFTTSLCVVTADQFPMLAGDFPELFAATQRMIGYWFWELDHIPSHMRRSFALVDEIWAGSRFVTDAFAAVAPVPVRHVPIPVAEPIASSRVRADFTRLHSVAERPLFLVTFDHLSVTERKNPVGVIEAFRRAFAPDEGPVLVIKTMNGHQRWPNHQRVLAAAEGRNDVIVWDETLDRADQMALVAAADCLVSLHRSEGLGLHLAEAMWLGTPVIATRYSGNLDFMDDDNSLLIDARLVNVEHGEGVYPPIAKWADPDLAAAAAAMRRIAGDAALSSQLATAGRETMERQPSLADTGRLIRQLLLGGEPGGE